MFRKQILTILAAVMLFAAANVQAIPPDYDITYLGTLGGNKSFAYGINDFGVVVGESGTGNSYESRAFKWEDGVMEDLGAFGAGTWGLEMSCAYSINNQEQIVGYSSYDSQDFESPNHAFLFENNEMHDLGTFGGINSCAYSINNQGQIVGMSQNVNRKERGFIYENEDMQDIGVLEERSFNPTYAYAINDNGRIVGKSYTSNAYNAFLWDDGIMNNLGFYDEYGSSALDINNNGQIVGSVTFRSPGGGIVSQAILWEDGNMINLGYLENPESFATAINDLGQIVGFSRVVRGNSSHFHACIWDVDGQIYDLNNFFPSGYRTHAYDINNNGQIVGYAELPGGTDYRGFIMTPIPEPTTLLLFLTGGLFMRKIS